MHISDETDLEEAAKFNLATWAESLDIKVMAN